MRDDTHGYREDCECCVGRRGWAPKHYTRYRTTGAAAALDAMSGAIGAAQY